jgi:hypothetical protein
MQSIEHVAHCACNLLGTRFAEVSTGHWPMLTLPSLALVTDLPEGGTGRLGKLYLLSM